MSFQTGRISWFGLIFLPLFLSRSRISISKSAAEFPSGPLLSLVSLLGSLLFPSRTTFFINFFIAESS